MTNKSNTLILKMFRVPLELKSALTDRAYKDKRCSNITNFPLFLLPARALDTRALSTRSEREETRIYFHDTSVTLVVLQELV